MSTKGDSNRCRNAYEKILNAELPRAVLEHHKKNKHCSVRRASASSRPNQALG